MYRPIHICLWTTSWRQFKFDCHQNSSVIPLATGDEVSKFLKVKGQGRWGGMRCTERPSSCFCCRLLWLSFFDALFWYVAEAAEAGDVPCELPASSLPLTARLTKPATINVWRRRQLRKTNREQAGGRAATCRAPGTAKLRRRGV